MFFLKAERCQVPGRHITDHQMELYMDALEGGPPGAGFGEGGIQHVNGVPDRV